jgi:hypothetical protein
MKYIEPILIILIGVLSLVGLFITYNNSLWCFPMFISIIMSIGCGVDWIISIKKSED